MNTITTKFKPKTIYVKPKIKNLPINIKKDTYTININECIICLQNNVKSTNLMHINTLKHKDIKLQCKCNYYIHLQCLLQWTEVNPTCPTCRKSITKKPKYPKRKNRIRTARELEIRRNIHRNIHRNIRRNISQSNSTNQPNSTIQANSTNQPNSTNQTIEIIYTYVFNKHVLIAVFICISLLACFILAIILSY